MASDAEVLEKAADQVAVFVVRDGQWRLWATYPGPISARHEADYLTNCLGVTAQIFRRAA